MNRLGLDRFVQAQECIYTKAFSEIQSGRKKTHWMWFIFPQLRGLGKSLMSYTYGIADLEEAKVYLADPILGPRLERISAELLKLEETDPEVIFGTIDAMKLQSCMTLFAQANENPNSVYRNVLERYFDQEEDVKTLRILLSQLWEKRPIGPHTRGRYVPKKYRKALQPIKRGKKKDEK